MIIFSSSAAHVCIAITRLIPLSTIWHYTLVLLLSIGIQILEIPICQKNSQVSEAQDK